MYRNLIEKLARQILFDKFKHVTLDQVIVKIRYWSYVFRYIDFGVTKTSIVDSLTKFTRELYIYSAHDRATMKIRVLGELYQCL